MAGTAAAPQPVRTAAAAKPKEREGKGEVLCVEVSTEATPRSNNEGADYVPVSFWRLFSHTTPLDWSLMAIGTLGAMANGCAMPLFALAFGSYTDGFTAVDAMSGATAAATKFVYLALGVFAAFYLQAACWIRTGSRQAASMRIAFLKSVMRQDVAFFENQTSSGALLRSLNEDTAAYQQAVSEKMGIFTQHLTTFVVGFIVAFWRGWEMTLVLLACLPLLGAVGLALSKLSARIESSSADAYAQAQDLAQQAMTQVRTVAAFGMEQGTVDKYDRALEYPEKVGITQGLLTGLSLGSLNLVLFSAYAASLYYGATRVAAGAMSGGDVLAVMMAALLGAYSLGQAAPLLQYFLAGRAAAGRLTAVDRLQPGINVDAPGQQLQHVSGELQLRGVCFMYPSLGVQVLDGVDLSIPAGQTLALVGSSGSGKSTIIGLLQRFYDPSAGAVLLDGVDIRKLQLRWLRSQMALVSQEASLFATTIFENIAMGRPDASEEEVLDAARAALVDSFVSLLPQGYETHVGSRGIALSGGQRQRIAIARAILKNPRILLLDEATSALDSASEAAVSLALQNLAGTCIAQDSFSSSNTAANATDIAASASSSSSSSSSGSQGRTVVMVAHRLSTVRHADKIVVMAQGRVVEQGTHVDLLSNPKGAYTNLVQLQSRSGSGGGAAGHTLHQQPESLYTVHSVLTEQESFHSMISLQSFHSAVSGWSSLSGGQHNSSSGISSSSSNNGRGWFSRVGMLRRRSLGSLGGSSGGGAKGNVETSFAPCSKQQRAGLTAAAAASLTAAAGKPPQGLLKPVKTVAPKQPSSFWRLLRIVRSETPCLLVGALGCIGHGSMMPAFATLLTSVLAMFHAPSTAEMLQQARMYALSLAAVGLGACCAVAVQFYTFGAVGTKLARRLRVMLLGAILRQEIGWHDQPEHAPSKMASLLATDTASARGAVADLLGLALQTLGALGFGYAVAFYCDWRVALLVSGLLPVLVSGAVIQTRYMLGSSASGSGGTEDQAAATTAVTEALAAIHVVQAYNLQDRVCSLYRRMLDAAVPQERRACHVAGLSLAYSQAAMFIVTAIVVYFGGAEVSSGRATFENMLKAFMSIVFAAMGVAQAMVSFPEIGKAGPAVQRMMGLLHPHQDGSASEGGSSSSRAGGSGGSSSGAAGKGGTGKELVLVTADDASTSSELMRGRIPDLQGHVQLVNVWFSYPTRPDVRVLQDFSIDIPACSTIALVGRSGSGKSTVISLLQRFYEPDSGTVLLDGVDIRCLDLAWLRKQMGLVSQDCLLFQGTLEDNIRYGTEHATSQQVVDAAKAAHAHDFISAMPHGFNTIVGGKGSIKLSGGQRQRIAIARAIIRDPKILLLDEATSALDAASEAIVSRALNELASGSKPLSTPAPAATTTHSSSKVPCRITLGNSAFTSPAAAAAATAAAAGGTTAGARSGRTTIIVAHRLATVTAADTIAVMSTGGELLEMGSPGQLMSSGAKGHYAQMVMQQQHATPLAAAAAALQH